VRVLLDECLPRRLKQELLRHDVRTAPEMGWASKRNGELLQVAQREFDVFLTVDRNLQQEQNLANFDIAVIVLVARSNRLDDLRPLMSAVRESLSIAKRGAALVVEGGKS
jgi:predicted nuclease of predicted toxin-antitoxin system